MYYTIYRTTNKVNNKHYIGKHKTIDLNDEYLGSGKLLQRAINKYGKDYFVKEIIHIFDNEEDMNSMEKEMVIVSEDTYNLCEGGKGGFGYINRNRLNKGDRFRKAHEVYKIDPKFKEKRILHSKKANLTIQKMSKKERKERGIGQGFKGKYHTEETNLKRKKTWKQKIENGWAPWNKLPDNPFK